MKKKAFLYQLRCSLSVLSEKEKEEALAYYSEMIEDSIEEGKTEEEAVTELGTLEEIVKKVLENYEGPMYKESRPSSSPDRTLILLLCSPLIFVGVCVLFSLLLVLYSLIIAGFCVAFSFGIISIAAIIDAGIHFFNNVDLALFQSGLAIFSLGCCFCLTPLMIKSWRGSINMTIKLTNWFKNTWKEVK